MAEVRLLGPVELHVEGRLVELGSPKQRIVLAALASEAPRVVSVRTLIDRVWGDRPPADPRGVLYSYLARVRRCLAQGRSIGGQPVALTRRSGGYLLEIDPERVDVCHFRDLVGRARGARCRDDERAQLLRAALALWRGEPLAGLSGQWVERTAWTWQQQYLDTVAAWARAEVAVANPTAAIGPLTELTGEHPLSESLASALMYALHAAGRVGDALHLFEQIRSRLVEELGTDPGTELQRLHQAILRGDDLDGPCRAPAKRAGAAPVGSPELELELERAERERTEPYVPAQLPLVPYGFVGRDEQVALLDAVLARTGEMSRAVVISAVSGIAGVGKTALVMHWAHRVRDRFPDGQLYVDLRGFHPDLSPVVPSLAVRDFLVALGTPAQRIPASNEAQIALYRSLLADRRVLIVLDNARDAAQVRPLLPGAPACLVVVTSRSQLSSLVAAEGAQPMTLDLLSAADARCMLVRRLGQERLDAEPAAVRDIIARCAGLPLALAVIAARAAARPTFDLSHLAEELRDARRGLDLFDGGDTAADLRAVFSWSYRSLDGAAARLFRLLALHPGPAVNVPAAAALAGLPVGLTRRLMEELTRAHLVIEDRPGRYTLHDLLRLYAAEQVAAEESGQQRRAALGRVLDYYRAAAADAVEALFPADSHVSRMAPRSGPVWRPSGPDAARTWLDTERAVLVAISAHARRHGWPEHAIDLSGILSRYLENGHYYDALRLHVNALTSARNARDLPAQAASLIHLGTARMRLGQYKVAALHCHRALSLYRDLDDPAGQARALRSISTVQWRLGRYDRTAEYSHQALELYQKLNDQRGIAHALSSLGIAKWQQGQYSAAAELYQRALTLFRQFGDQHAQARTLCNLGLVHARLGRHHLAAEHYRAALHQAQLTGSRDGEAGVLTNLGDTYTVLGRYELAAEHHRRALALFRDIGDKYGQAGALNGLGETERAAGRPADALANHSAAHNIAAANRDSEEHARAHNGNGRAHLELGDDAQARQHWSHALAIYTDLGSSRADEIRACLNALERPRNTSGKAKSAPRE